MSVFKKIISYPLLIRSGIAAIDQAILSLINFIISFLLIKYSLKTEFGNYSIGFPITLFIIAVQNAIINTPLAVLLISKKGLKKLQYSASLFYGQFIVILPALCLGIVIIGILYYGGLDSRKAAIAAAICFASVGILFREFFRAFFFAEENPVRVLKLDTLYAVFYLGMIGVVFYFWEPNAVTIFILMGISALLIALYSRQHTNWQNLKLSVKESYVENWRFGRWALLGVLVTHVQDYSYIYLLGALLGSYAAADVSAARFLLTPLVLIQVGWIKVIVPYGSRLREEGKLYRFYKELALASLLFVAGVAIYTIILFYASDMLEKHVLSNKYAESFNYLLLWAIYFSIAFIGLNASYGLQVIKRFDIISKINLLTMLITVGCAYFLIQSHAIKGGLTALITGQIVLSSGLWIYFTRELFLYLKLHPKIGVTVSCEGRFFQAHEESK